MGNKVRATKANSIKQEFQIPEHIVLHWDGKICNVKCNSNSNRVAIYISGVNTDCLKKLLGAPEILDGTGQAEADIVTNLLTDWGIK